MTNLIRFSSAFFMLFTCVFSELKNGFMPSTKWTLLTDGQLKPCERKFVNTKLNFDIVTNVNIEYLSIFTRRGNMNQPLDCQVTVNNERCTDTRSKTIQNDGSVGVLNCTLTKPVEDSAEVYISCATGIKICEIEAYATSTTTKTTTLPTTTKTSTPTTTKTTTTPTTTKKSTPTTTKTTTTPTTTKKSTPTTTKTTTTPTTTKTSTPTTTKTTTTPTTIKTTTTPTTTKTTTTPTTTETTTTVDVTTTTPNTTTTTQMGGADDVTTEVDTSLTGSTVQLDADRTRLAKDFDATYSGASGTPFPSQAQTTEHMLTQTVSMLLTQTSFSTTQTETVPIDTTSLRHQTDTSSEGTSTGSPVVSGSSSPFSSTPYYSSTDHQPDTSPESTNTWSPVVPGSSPPPFSSISYHTSPGPVVPARETTTGVHQGVSVPITNAHVTKKQPIKYVTNVDNPGAGVKIGGSSVASNTSDETLSPMVIAIVAVLSSLVLVTLATVSGIVLYKQWRKRSYGCKLENVEESECNHVNLPDQTELNDLGDLNTEAAPAPNDSGDTDSGIKSEGGTVATCTSLVTDPIPVDQFPAHVYYLKKTNGFENEFKELPDGPQSSTLAADLANEGQIQKNRFSNIAPYDDSRVLLLKEKDTDSDYINASYIDGFAEVKAYIAAQGPLPSTVEDFWHMVWEEGCGKIIMLTNLSEGTMIKCEQYWPKMQGFTETFGRYTVTSTRVTERAHFVHRILDISKDEKEGCHQVHQFHFIAWPDHGVPCPVALVTFLNAVKLQTASLDGPLVVHCSAGIGRTGTFITLDMLVKQADTIGKLSLFSTVKCLRKQRVNMVQTLNQYKFLHAVLLDWLAGRNCTLIKEDLQHSATWDYAEEDSTDTLPQQVRQQVAEQFQMLVRLRPEVEQNQLATALRQDNVSKNRSSHILAADPYRVHLWVPNDSVSDYINAVFLPCLMRTQGYIATQLPLTETVADFWRMVFDWRVKNVVQFCNAPSDQDVCIFATEAEKEMSLGSVSLRSIGSSELADGITIYDLQLTVQESSEPAEKAEDDNRLQQPQTITANTRLYRVHSPDAFSLKSTRQLLPLVAALMPSVMTASQPPVIIQCFDGAGVSCVLACLMLALESLEMDGWTSIFSTARFVQTARPQALSTLEEYEFVVRCVLHYVRGIKQCPSGQSEATQ